MTVGRHDHVGAMTFVRERAAQPPTSLRAPTVGIFGDADPATENFADRYTAWSHLVGDISLEVVPGGEHYFVRDRADLVAARIDRDHPAETGAEEASA